MGNRDEQNVRVDSEGLVWTSEFRPQQLLSASPLHHTHLHQRVSVRHRLDIWMRLRRGRKTSVYRLHFSQEYMPNQ